MADESLNHFANKLGQLSHQIPANDTPDKSGYLEYQAGLDVILTYRGHPDTLDEAITHFVACEVRPYTFAGFAIVIKNASYLSGGQYIPEVLNMVCNIGSARD